MAMAAMNPAGFAPRWEIDKHINISVIFAGVCQVVAIVYFIASLNIRVSNLEQIVVSIAPAQERITKLEVKLENVGEGVSRIENHISKLVNPPPLPIIAVPPVSKRKK